MNPYPCNVSSSSLVAHLSAACRRVAAALTSCCGTGMDHGTQARACSETRAPCTVHHGAYHRYLISDISGGFGQTSADYQTFFIILGRFGESGESTSRWIHLEVDCHLEVNIRKFTTFRQNGQKGRSGRPHWTTPGTTGTTVPLPVLLFSDKTEQNGQNSADLPMFYS